MFAVLGTQGGVWRGNFPTRVRGERVLNSSHTVRHDPPRQQAICLVHGGLRRHLRGDWSRTPSGPEGSSGSDFKSGAEDLLARAASYKLLL